MVAMTIIIAFGDSVTWGACDREGGWVQRLRRHLEGNPENDATVYNAGISGDTTAGLLERMEQEIRTMDGERTVVIIGIGINDSMFLLKERRNAIPVGDFRKNLGILYLIAKRYSEKVIFVGLNPVDERVDPIPWLPGASYTNQHVERYNDTIEQFCGKNNLGFVEVFNEWLKQDYPRLLEDGLHPNSGGHERIFRAVREVLARKGLI
jgi:acyl-CoA thioesterase-1